MQFDSSTITISLPPLSVSNLNSPLPLLFVTVHLTIFWIECSRIPSIP